MTTIKTGNRRLLKLAALLEKLPRERFDYLMWVGDDWKGKRDLSCGTTACAMGWATTIPEFRKLGLHLKKETWGGRVAMGSFGAFGAAREIFGLELYDAYFLFDPADNSIGTDATPKQVAKHIRRFVARRDEGGAQ